MSDIIEKYKANWGDDPRTLLENYSYHTDLTGKLDALNAANFNKEILYEIVLKIYFHYLDELHRVESEKLPFEQADRILYQLDILLGNSLGDKT